MKRPWLYPSEHMAKAEVYQEFSDTFRNMVPVYRMSDKAQKKAEARRGFMRLALVDPLVRDGLRAALEAADEHWAGTPKEPETP